MVNQTDTPPEPSDAETPIDLVDRLLGVRDVIEMRISHSQAQLARHYTMRESLEADRAVLESTEEKATQNEMIAVVQGRIRSFDHQLNTLRHDLSLLQIKGELALENSRADTGDLARILEKYEGDPEYDPTKKPRLAGVDALPDFARPGQTSGITRFAHLTRFETFAHRAKVLLKVSVAVMVLVFLAQSLGPDIDGKTVGGARFESAGSGDLARLMQGSSGFEMPGSANILLRMVSVVSGANVTDLAGDTAQALGDTGTGLGN